MINQTSTARELARQAIRNTLSAADWERNWQFSQKLLEQINAHRIMKHPIMKALSGGAVTFEQMRQIHLEFFHAFAQVFTDAVIQTMFTTSQLEPRLGLGAKAAARFLLQFNLFEELGFKPGIDTDDSFCGNHRLAHYIQYGETLSQLGVTPAMLANHIPMTSSVACRATFEGCYGDHVMMSALLAVSETVFHDYATLWAMGVSQATNIDVTQGYHSIHVEDETGQSIEDGHSEEAWMLFTQAITPERYEDIQHKIQVWLTIWASFLDDLIAERSVQSLVLA